MLQDGTKDIVVGEEMNQLFDDIVKFVEDTISPKKRQADPVEGGESKKAKFDVKITNVSPPAFNAKGGEVS